MLRAVAGSLTIVAVFGARALAAGAASTEIPVPGGTVALARAIGLQTPPDPSRFVAEIARLTYGLPEGHKDTPSSTLSRLSSHLDAAARFQAALDGIPGSALSLTLASGSKDSREQLKDVLDLVDVRLKGNRGQYSVEPANDKAAAARVRLLVDLGVDLTNLARRLNAGESVNVSVPTELVPLPLDAVLWGDVILHRAVTAGRLFTVIVGDRRAALLAHGLAGLDDETLEYVASTPRLLERLYAEDAAPVFAAFAGSVRVHDGRMVTRGGEAAVPLWESVVGEKVSSPELFIHALLTRDNGHLAYVYDLVNELDAPRAAFALGLWMDDPRFRALRFSALIAAVDAAEIDWNVRDTPFARPLDDIGVLLLNVRAGPDGMPRAPAARGLWSRIFESPDLPESPSKGMERVDESDPVDAAWLAETVLGNRIQRSQRVQQFAFAQRAFGTFSRDHFGDMLIAVRALSAFPALILTVERMGILDPAAYADAARAASRLSEQDGTTGFVALEQFQGALALLSRMRESGGLDRSQAESLLASLSAIPLTKDGQYGARFAHWTRSDLLPAIAPQQSVEDAVLAALAGATPAAQGGAERLTWEGERYRLDIPVSEERRLRSVREHQQGYSIGIALGLEAIAARLESAPVELPAVQNAVADLQPLLPMLAAGKPRAGTRSTIVQAHDSLDDAADTVSRAIRDLSRITKEEDVARARGVAESLGILSGAVLGDALGALAYAIQLPDSADGASLVADLARRHDFGLGLKDKGARRAAAWAIPQQVVEPGVPRRVMGSLLGLDMAFAPLMLRRVVSEPAASAPRLLSNDRDTFTRSVALLDPYTMRNVDRDAIAAGIARGRARVEAAMTAGASNRSNRVTGGESDGADTLDALAAEITMDGWRRRATQWELLHDPQRVLSFFSLNELLALGAPRASVGDAGVAFAGWGMSNTPLSGCLCTRLAAPNEWRIVAGRPQLGIMASATPDLNLHVAVMLAELHLPAALARMVVGAAMQEFVDTVQPNDASDWLTIIRGARTASRERIEDDVAAATADGPLVREANYAEQQR